MVRWFGWPIGESTPLASGWPLYGRHHSFAVFTVRIPPALASLLPAFIWVALAWRSPSSTHHFAPLVVAMAWGFLAEPTSRRDSVRAAVGGVAVAWSTVVVLGLAGRLDGPTLWGSRPSWPELAAFGALGALIVVIRGMRRGRDGAPASAERPQGRTIDDRGIG